MAQQLPSAGMRRSCSWLLHLLLLLLVVMGPEPTMCKRSSAKLDMERRRHGAVAEWTTDWETVADIPNLEAAEFDAQTSFLLDMCSNAYKYDYQEDDEAAVAGARRLPDPDEDPADLSPVAGWTLSETVSPLTPSKDAAGLRALVYEEEATPLEEDTSLRTVLVFRGWQTSSTSIHDLADLCAGKRLFPGYVDFLSPPSLLCSYFFNEPSLDYLSQAIAYTRLVLSYYNSSSLLLTGHGFGGGLALLVSAALQNELHDVCSSCNVGGGILQNVVRQQHAANDLCRITLPVISFSGPGIDQYLKGWKLYNTEYLITITQSWDYFSVRAKWRGYRGWLCKYNVTEPHSCTECFSDELRAYSLKLLNPNTMKKVEGIDHNDADDCPCHHDVNESCWDCLTDTNTLEALRREPAETPICEFYD